jgi:hypothetical protein
MVLLQHLLIAVKLLVDVREGLLEVVKGMGGADARHHILTLGVVQILSIKDGLSRRRIASEGHA